MFPPISESLTSADGRAMIVHVDDKTNCVPATTFLRRLEIFAANLTTAQLVAVAAVHAEREGRHTGDVLETMLADLIAYEAALGVFFKQIPGAVTGHRQSVGALDDRAKLRLNVALSRSKSAADRIERRRQTDRNSDITPNPTGQSSALIAAGLSPVELRNILSRERGRDTDARAFDLREVELWNAEVETLRTFLADVDRSPSLLGALLPLVEAMPLGIDPSKGFVKLDDSKFAPHDPAAVAEAVAA